jgi:hypothetical protein
MIEGSGPRALTSSQDASARPFLFLLPVFTNVLEGAFSDVPIQIEIAFRRLGPFSWA